MNARIAFVLACALIAAPAMADEPETKRDVIVEKHDADSNKRLDGKEMKNFKKQNPKMYESLMTFCEAANEHPKKMGVDLPADPSKEQLQCKKKHVSRLFLNAWTAEGRPLQPENVDQPSRAEDGHPR
jgi:hypothetical protein